MRGFLLVPSYRVERGVPCLRLWGVLETGESCLILDRRFRPYCFVRTADAERARHLGAPPPHPEALRTLAGEAASRLTLGSPADLAGLRHRLHEAGIATFEADIRFVSRYLMDLGIRGAFEVEGSWSPGEGVARTYADPRLAPASLAPALRVLSLDVETDPRATRLLSVALHGRDRTGGEVAEVIVVEPPAGAGGGAAPPLHATLVAGERALLERLAERVRAIDPDVVSGWNVVGFDLLVVERRARALGLPLALGRGPAPLRVILDRSTWGASRADIEGRAVLDGVDLLRGAFLRLEDYRLDTVARAVLGEGKTIAGADRGAEIERRYREDLEGFCAYNLRDAELVSRILETTGLVRLAVSRSLLTGMPLDRVAASIASFDSLYLPELRRRGFVAPTVPAAAAAEEPTAGGAVLSPEPGLHEMVLVFDFRSLYPSLIRTFNIDPLTRVEAPRPGEDLIHTPEGSAFRREPAILPALLDRLLEVRASARRSRDAKASQATKILMNSFYGVLATPACRFHCAALANAITRTGQALLLWTRARVEELGHRVLYGDTDSLFVRAARGDAPLGREQALRTGHDLARRLNRDLARHLQVTYRVESRLDLELEGLFLKLFFPAMRHGAGAARKRYAGLLVGAEPAAEGAPGTDERLVFVGLESVRRDWTDAAREFQRGLYARLFAEEGAEPVRAYVREFVRSLRAGEKDAALVYRKVLRKEASAYTRTTPPHVQAARRSGSRRRRVEYVVTSLGPEPVGERQGRLDAEHYVEKQIRPLAEAVLPLLGLEWDEVMGNPRQPRLL